MNRSLNPPILPKVKGPLDHSNFDNYPPDEDGVAPDDVTGWDINF